MAFLSYFIYPFPDSIAYATHTFSHLPSVVYCVKYRGCWVYEDPQISTLPLYSLKTRGKTDNMPV